MSKELRIDFQGVIAFVPDRDFDKQPTQVNVVVRDLAEPRTIIDAKGTPRLVGSHHAWLEFTPQDRVKGSGEPDGIFELTKDGSGTALGILLLRRQYISIRPDSEKLPAGTVSIDKSVLDHLAIYKGPLKTAYQPNPLGSDEVAAAFPLTGGILSVQEKTVHPYEIPRPDGPTVQSEIATTLSWTIPFQKEVVLFFAPNPTSPSLRFRPATNGLHLVVRNRELDQLFKPPLTAIGGQDDPESLVYGDSIVGGQPGVLISATGPIPGGHRACAPAGIEA